MRKGGESIRKKTKDVLGARCTHYTDMLGPRCIHCSLEKKKRKRQSTKKNRANWHTVAQGKNGDRKENMQDRKGKFKK